MKTVTQQTCLCRPVILAPQEAETEESRIQGQPVLWSEFKASSGNLVIPCLKMKSKTRPEDALHK